MNFANVFTGSSIGSDRRTKILLRSRITIVLMVGYSFILSAQSPSDRQPAVPPKQQAQPVQLALAPVDLKSLPRNIFLDQKNIVTSPFHMTASEWQWTVPLAFVGAGLLASDTAIEKRVPTNPSTVSHAVTASNAGLAAMGALGGGMFLLGHFANNDQERETGILSAEAGFDAFLDTEVLGYAFGRQRPFAGTDRGYFFHGGDSFPSQHAAISWAIASVIAHEYSGPLTKLLVYGLATGVDAARFVGHEHWASDVLVGSALGWYTGRQVFSSRSHYSNAEIARWGAFNKTEDAGNGRDPSNMGSPYVPLDSWIYPAMERLIALGYIQSADLGMRPWTRMECARLLQEASQPVHDDSANSRQAPQIYKVLAAEFTDELARLDGAPNLGISLDSIYTRGTQIVGSPLRDGFHFGQTIVNDYGRPYSQGFNNVTGFSAHSTVGPLFFYLRTEYQHAPSAPGDAPLTAQTIKTVDFLPTPPPTTPIAAANQMDLLEGYVGMQLDNWQFTIGKQALWWGADRSGPMLFSTNAAPILMLQVSRVKPFKLPLLGNTRLDYLVGRLTGYHWVNSATTGYSGSWTQTLSDQPFIVGEKVSLKPTSDLELGISVTALFGGPGVPANLHKLLQAGFSSGNGEPGSPSDPGDRRGGFDFNYRVPGMRDWLSFYADAFTDDEPNPWLAWNKTALTSGLYLSRVPGIQKVDFRVEGIYTDPPGSKTTQDGFFYHNDRFLSGYTNNGNLIGSWIGRQGQGADAWTSYWINPKSKIQLNFRHQKTSKEFIPGGGTLTDFGVSGDYQLRSNLGLSAWVQHERWLFPVIQPGAARNVTAAIQISFEPQKWLHRSAANADANQP
ncbi:MAG: capsule assembly Wzi family protein [Candidatus Sulfotelmatobacter sp.]|jgi:membrane-associated phospholipid phosphatase